MTRLEKILFLNKILLEEMPEYKTDAEKFNPDEFEQRQLLRALMNMRPPQKLRKDFIKIQDELLTEETKERGIVNPDDLPTLSEKSFFREKSGQFAIWQGDITRLAADAIVNAANAALLGCFIPGHNCIDNVIHSAAGLQLREKCAEIMKEQGHEEITGNAKITPAFNLPSKFVIHTVGPIIHASGRGEFKPTDLDSKLLARCYTSCLNLAAENNLKSIAFCCISTGVFHFPHDKAAEIAVKTSFDWLKNTGRDMKIIFNVFKDEDKIIYEKFCGGENLSLKVTE